MSLRDKKKKQTKEKILSTAKMIFEEHGYENTTIEKIAKKAEIGTGTLYNYYKSKAEIFIEVMSAEFNFDDLDINKMNYEFESDIIELIIIYTTKSIKTLKYMNKKLLRELLAASLNSSIKNNSVLLKGVMSLDYKYLDRLKDFLDKKKAYFYDDFNSEDAAYTIYGILMSQMFIYMYDESSFEDSLNKIKNQIRFVFKGKCKKYKEE
jgi:AcrR family transcriptional regulator